MIYNSVGLRLAYSPDGLIWTPASEEALFNYHSDTHNYVVWNQQLSMWMLYMRPPIFFHEGPGICYYRRRIAVSAPTYWIGQYYVQCFILMNLIVPISMEHMSFHIGDLYIGLITLLNQEDGGSNEVMLATRQDWVCW